MMKTMKTPIILLTVVLMGIPASAGGKKKNEPGRAMLEKMEAQNREA
jgi:hypothetical protein